jgi:hypothetical protein
MYYQVSISSPFKELTMDSGQINWLDYWEIWLYWGCKCFVFHPHGALEIHIHEAIIFFAPHASRNCHHLWHKYSILLGVMCDTDFHSWLWGYYSKLQLGKGSCYLCNIGSCHYFTSSNQPNLAACIPQVELLFYTCWQIWNVDLHKMFWTPFLCYDHQGLCQVLVHSYLWHLDVNLGSDFVFCVYIMCRPFGGRFTVRKVVGSRFIIISGNLTYRTVQDFLSEFYHPNHNRGSSP